MSKGDLKLLTHSKVVKVEDNSDVFIESTRLHFKNGHELNIIKILAPELSPNGLFEIMPSAAWVLPRPQAMVLAGLTAEDVKTYIHKVADLPKRAKQCKWLR